MPGVDALPVPVRARHIPPRRPRSGAPQHPVDHLAVVAPPATPTRRPIGQQRLQPCPLRVGQVMPIMHRRCLPDPSPKIRETRPRRSAAAVGVALTTLGICYGIAALSGWEPSWGYLARAVIHIGEL